MATVVIANETISGRAVIDADAVPTYEARGWVVVGVTTDPRRDPIVTDDEAAEAEASTATRIEQLLTPVDAPDPSDSTAAAESTTPEPADAAVDDNTTQE